MAPPHSSYWLAVDSDGAVFDAMTPKHEQAFAPALIEVWGLHAIASFARERFLQLNLRSPARGANRFVALALFFQDLRKHVAAGQLAGIPALDGFYAWVTSEPQLSEASLAAAAALAPEDLGLERALAWSAEVNRRIRGLPRPAPFPGAAAALALAARHARVAVVSSGHGPTIRAEWRHSGLERHVTDFFTQENGTKADLLRQLAAGNGEPRRVLMIGDAPADHAAALAAGVPFFAIVPGSETASWSAFAREEFARFLADGYGPLQTAAAVAQLQAALGVT